jgi:hypothetical protein
MSSISRVLIHASYLYMCMFMYVTDCPAISFLSISLAVLGIVYVFTRGPCCTGTIMKWLDGEIQNYETKGVLHPSRFTIY